MDTSARISQLGTMPDLGAAAYYEVIRAAVVLNLFTMCSGQPLTVGEIAQRCSVVAIPVLEEVLEILASLGFLEKTKTRYRIGARGRRLTDKEHGAWVLHRHSEVSWYAHLLAYLRTGQPLQIHENMNDEQWRVYQDAMRATTWGNHLAAISFPLAPGAILDIGGSSGSVVKPLLNRYPLATATIVELPEVVRMMDGVENAGAFSGRLRYQAADARSVDIEPGRFDLIIIASLLHHLSRVNADGLLRRAAAALKPQGTLAVLHRFSQPAAIADDPFDRAAALLFTLSSGKEEFTYDEFCLLLTEAGVSTPTRHEMWHISSKLV